MCVCVRVYCLYKTFLKTKCQVSNFFTKKITLELKLKWDTFLWIGGVEYVIPRIFLFEVIIKFSFKYNCWAIGFLLLVTAAN